MKYPDINSIGLTTPQVQRIIVKREKYINTVKDYGSIFPAPKGYDLYFVDAELDGKELKYSIRKTFN